MRVNGAGVGYGGSVISVQTGQERGMRGHDRRVTALRRREIDNGGVSLARVRRWFADDETPQTPPEDGGGEGGKDWASLPGWARDEVESLRSRLSEVNNESAQRRHQLKEYEERLQRLEADRQTRLTVEEKLKEAQAQADSLRQYEEKAKALETRIRESNQQRINAIPETQRSLVPVDEMTPERLATWLDRNEALLRKPIAPNLDGGAGGDSPKQVVLSEDEKRMAARFGMSAEEWVKYKERANK